MKGKSISQKQIVEEWFLIDAAGMRIGKVSSIVAELLLGKTDPLVRTNLDPMKKVVVINSSKIDFTPKRGFSKFYKSYSGYPSGLTVTDLDTKFEKNPNFVIENAVRGMLPKTKMGRKLITSLKIYETEAHNHEANKPVVINAKEFKI